MKKNFLLLKGSSRTILLIKKIRKYYPGSKIILIDKNIKCPAKKYSDIFYCADAENYKLIKKKILKNNIFMCLTRSSGLTGLIASKFNNYFGFNKADLKIVSQFFSGYKLSNLCRKNNLDFIKTKYLKQNFSFSSPLVMKADIEKIGKKNVFYIKSDKNFIKHLNLQKICL